MERTIKQIRKKSLDKSNQGYDDNSGIKKSTREDGMMLEVIETILSTRRVEDQENINPNINTVNDAYDSRRNKPNDPMVDFKISTPQNHNEEETIGSDDIYYHSNEQHYPGKIPRPNAYNDRECSRMMSQNVSVSQPGDFSMNMSYIDSRNVSMTFDQNVSINDGIGKSDNIHMPCILEEFEPNASQISHGVFNLDQYAGQSNGSGGLNNSFDNLRNEIDECWRRPADNELDSKPPSGNRCCDVRLVESRGYFIDDNSKDNSILDVSKATADLLKSKETFDLLKSKITNEFCQISENDSSFKIGDTQPPFKKKDAFIEVQKSHETNQLSGSLDMASLSFMNSECCNQQKSDAGANLNSAQKDPLSQIYKNNDLECTQKPSLTKGSLKFMKNQCQDQQKSDALGRSTLYSANKDLLYQIYENNDLEWPEEAPLSKKGYPQTDNIRESNDLNKTNDSMRFELFNNNNPEYASTKKHANTKIDLNQDKIDSNNKSFAKKTFPDTNYAQNPNNDTPRYLTPIGNEVQIQKDEELIRHIQKFAQEISPSVNSQSNRDRQNDNSSSNHSSSKNSSKSTKLDEIVAKTQEFKQENTELKSQINELKQQVITHKEKAAIYEKKANELEAIFNQQKVEDKMDSIDKLWLEEQVSELTKMNTLHQDEIQALKQNPQTEVSQFSQYENPEDYLKLGSRVIELLDHYSNGRDISYHPCEYADQDLNHDDYKLYTLIAFSRCVLECFGIFSLLSLKTGYPLKEFLKNSKFGRTDIHYQGVLTEITNLSKRNESILNQSLSLVDEDLPKKVLTFFKLILTSQEGYRRKAYPEVENQHLVHMNELQDEISSCYAEFESIFQAYGDNFDDANMRLFVNRIANRALHCLDVCFFFDL